MCTDIKDHIPDPTALDIRSKLFSSRKRRTCCDRLLLSKRTYPGWYCLFAPFMFKSKRWLSKLLFAFMFLLIGFSRMYLGVHTPKDVVVSMAVSLCISFAVYKASDFLLDSTRYRRLILLSLLLLSSAVSIYALFLLSHGDISLHYASDCCKASAAGIGFGVGWYLENRYVNFSVKGSIPFQIGKLIIGLLVAVSFKIGIEFLFGDSLPADMFAYFLLVLWVIFLYPWILKKFHRSSSTQN